jgi:hypothetical protein
MDFGIKDYNVKERSISAAMPASHSSAPDFPSGGLGKSKDSSIRLGTVSSAIEDARFGFAYLVTFSTETSEWQHPCIHLSRFSSPLNEEFCVLSTNTPANETGMKINYSLMPGDHVAVAFPNASRNSGGYGIILGSLPHGRSVKPWTKNKNIVHYSSIAGLEQSISTKGEYTITFNGIPQNLKSLTATIDSKKIEKKFNKIKGGTTLRFIEDGSFSINDNKKDKDNKPENTSITLSKPTSSISLTSLSFNRLEVNGTSSSISLASKVISLNTVDNVPKKIKDKEVPSSVQIKSDSISVEAVKKTVIKSPQIVIGNGEVELLTLLVKFFDILSTYTLITPVGPAQPFQIDAGGAWAQLKEIRDKIEALTKEKK